MKAKPAKINNTTITIPPAIKGSQAKAIIMRTIGTNIAKLTIKGILIIMQIKKNTNKNIILATTSLPKTLVLKLWNVDENMLVVFSNTIFFLLSP